MIAVEQDLGTALGEGDGNLDEFPEVLRACDGLNGAAHVWPAVRGHEQEQASPTACSEYLAAPRSMSQAGVIQRVEHGSGDRRCELLLQLPALVQQRSHFAELAGQQVIHESGNHIRHSTQRVEMRW